MPYKQGWETLVINFALDMKKYPAPANPSWLKACLFEGL